MNVIPVTVYCTNILLNWVMGLQWRIPEGPGGHVPPLDCYTCQLCHHMLQPWDMLVVLPLLRQIHHRFDTFIIAFDRFIGARIHVYHPVCLFVCLSVCVCVYVCHDVCPDDLTMKDWCHTNNILQVHCWGCLVLQVMFHELMTSLMTSQDHKVGQILKLIYLRQYLS